MKIHRRDFLVFMGVATSSLLIRDITSIAQNQPSADLPFKPIKLPIPLAIQNLSESEQKTAYKTFEVMDDLILPEGFTYDIIATWGDPVGDSRFGYNNDYVSLVETSPNEGFLTVNFEYISGKTWMTTYEQVLGKSLPFEEVKQATRENKGKINAFALADNDSLKGKIRQIAEEGLIDQGIGIISIRRQEDGTWIRTYSSADRRITGISGLKDGKYLNCTGPAVAVFEKPNKEGYEDGLGSKIIGTFQNCAGGTTPWGTVFSAEENFQDQVPEAVKADGSSRDPSELPFVINSQEVDGRGNVLGLAGNKYGWMVEVDPANPEDYGTKHTWLGRYRHEAVAFYVREGKPLAVYSGCDRRGGHLYKFVSEGTIKNPTDKANSRLMETGMLYGAKFNPDGTGVWIALNPETIVDPVLPSQLVAGRKGYGLVALPNPNRAEGGIMEMIEDESIVFYKSQFKTLGDLYVGTPEEKQGAILIDAHFAANAAGVTCTARPEDTETTAEGTLYITYTSGTPGNDGAPDKRIFRGPHGEVPYEFGWIMKLQEDNQDPAALTFRWQLLATGGEPAQGGLGFSNPDNILIDRQENLWMVTDISTSIQNQNLASRFVNGNPVNQINLLGVFGSNTAWLIPTKGTNAGNAYPFAIGPVETELTGIWFTRDYKTLFSAVQHPGELGGVRQDSAMEKRSLTMTTTMGTAFSQERLVPIGSNWPSKQVNQPPKPSVVAIRRIDNQAIV